ncbi:MAG TPA: hypothetical protein VLF94_00805 [Chlamydiales bacterium]|nr:hypothetical protein [Chlamydiales bacterium]
MDSLLLSRLTKDFLNQDPERVSGRERYRLGWAGSVMASHPKATGREKKVAHLLALRERLSGLFERGGEERAVPLFTGPKLTPPPPPPPATYRPPRYFYRGDWEKNKRKNPEPIAYLLTETNETSLARPVPGNSLLIRSLCKGKGVLRQNGEGMVYLDIDNRFISMLLPYLKAHDLVRPPYFNLFAAPTGAHVPVIPAREVAFQYLDQIEQLGREFSFEIEGLYSMKPTSWPEVEQVWFFKLKSEELEQLRRKYFLPSIPGGHAFHIAVAVKPSVAVKGAPHPLPLMRINMAFIAA